MNDLQIIKIGVTGHLYLNETDLLFESVKKSLQTIRQMHPGKSYGFYSPLAPGADTISAEAALESGIPLHILFPCDRVNDYTMFERNQQEHFNRLSKKADSVIEIEIERNKSIYQTIGDYLVEKMDYLLVIWNGQDARGPGGTGDVRKIFHQTGKPWIWIRANNMVPGAPIFLPPGLQQGSIEWINW